MRGILSVRKPFRGDPLSTLLPSVVPSTGIGFRWDLAREFVVCQATANHLFHNQSEPLEVIGFPLVKAKALLITYACKWNGSTLTYVPFSVRLNRLQKFSMLFVCTLSLTVIT